MFHKMAALVAVSLLGLPSFCLAEWADGVQVCTSPSYEDTPGITSDGAHGAIVAWRDLRDENVNGGVDVYAQRLGFGGFVAWAPLGVVVTADSASQDGTSLIADGTGGAYFAWIDNRDYWTNQRDIYLQRLMSDGSIAPGWSPNGIPICTVPGDQYLPKLALDDAGGAYVVWEDFRVTGSVFDYSQVDIYGQRVTPFGKALWPVGGLPICVVPGGKLRVNVLADGEGGFFVEWSDLRSYNVSQTDLYALRVTRDGEIPANWPGGGLPICTAPRWQDDASLATDGAGGFCATWVDTRSAPTVNETGIEQYTDIYAQRVTGDGQIPTGWPVNGLPLCQTPRISQSPALLPDGEGGAIVAWADYRNYTSSSSDLYAQRVLANGQIGPGWPVNGLAISRTRGFEESPCAVSDGMGGALVAFSGTPGGNYDVFVQHVLGSGQIAQGWSANGEPVSSMPSQKAHPVAVSDGRGGMIVAWEDFRDEQGDIYAQLVPGDFPTAIQWSLASATAEPGRVVLVWQGHGLSASSPIVQRRGAATEWRGIGEPRLESGALVFEDRSVSEGRYAYRLVSARDPHDVLAVEVWVAVPGGSTLALVGFTPNPAPRSPVVSFSLSTSAPARLELFDVGGRQVRAQEVGGMGPGAHHLAVARDQPLAAGVYWLRLSQQGRTVTAKGLIAQ